MTTKILLIGKDGLVGCELRRSLMPVGDVVAVGVVGGLPSVDLTDPEAIRALIRDVKPKVIVNAAQLGDGIDDGDISSDAYYKVNATAPGIMAQEATSIGASLVHYSTAQVFDGTSSQPYFEDSLANPVSAYGQSMLAGEVAVRRSAERFVILRLGLIYTRRTAIELLKRAAVSLSSVDTVCPTWSRSAADATAHLVSQMDIRDSWARNSGVYHLATTRNDTLRDFTWAVYDHLTTQEVDVGRPLDAGDEPSVARNWSIDCTKLYNRFGIRLPNWKECLAVAMET